MSRTRGPADSGGGGCAQGGNGDAGDRIKQLMQEVVECRASSWCSRAGSWRLFCESRASNWMDYGV